MEKKTETVQVTDDNLITWGYTDNVLRVAPESIEEAMEGLLGSPR